ncbi:aquaporin-10 isoform X1 [Numida meleagris]|uniref:aquaporin-10 isoform X1 n=1 Tax=Numida meleagris TaxID=8996 RepID=UPI000B3D9C29|nr:aquaporin-10 isoform X1 [Numida meleagris]
MESWSRAVGVGRTTETAREEAPERRSAPCCPAPILRWGAGAAWGLSLGLGAAVSLLLQLITLGGAAQMVTSSGTKGNIITSSLAGALAVMVAIYTAGGVSGAHLNPAFSLAMSLLGQLPWWKFPIFVAVQTFGSFIAAGAVYALYYGTQSPRRGRGVGAQPGGLSLVHSSAPQTPSGPTATGPSRPPGPGRPPPSLPRTPPSTCPSPMASWTRWVPAPQPHTAPHGSQLRPRCPQVLGTAVLIVGILAITDTRNRAVPRGLEPVAVALLVLAIEVSMGSNCGSPMNPARDLGPRLFTLAAGWGTEVFSRGSAWWWVPVVAPLVGAALGTGLYQLFVAFHHPEEEEDGGRERRQTKH